MAQTWSEAGSAPAIGREWQGVGSVSLCHCPGVCPRDRGGRWESERVGDPDVGERLARPGIDLQAEWMYNRVRGEERGIPR